MFHFETLKIGQLGSILNGLARFGDILRTLGVKLWSMAANSTPNSASSLQQRIEKISHDFAALGTWEEKYQKIISMGKSLPVLPPEMQTDEAKVKGCQSQVWLHSKIESGKIYLQGDSDALLVRGLVALVVEVYSGSTPQEVLMTPPDFLKSMGFEGNLSPSRANGLFSMIKQIRYFAMAYASLS